MGSKKEKVWLAMRVTYRREMLARQILEGEGIESFIPMRYQLSKGKKKKT